MIDYLQGLLSSNGILRVDVRFAPDMQWQRGNLVALDQIGGIFVLEDDQTSAVPWDAIGSIRLRDSR